MSSLAQFALFRVSFFMQKPMSYSNFFYCELKIQNKTKNEARGLSSLSYCKTTESKSYSKWNSLFIY